MSPALPRALVVARERAVQVPADQVADAGKRRAPGLLIRLRDDPALEVLAGERGVAAEHDPSGLGQVDDERLVTGCVPGGRDDAQAGRDLGLALDRQVPDVRPVPVL